MFEAEIKYLADGPVTLPGRLLPDAVYHDRYYDASDACLAGSGQELRLRETGGRTVLTYKRPPFDPATASKEELETAVADGPATGRILEVLGFAPRLAFTKHCRRGRDRFQGLSLDITVVTVDFSPHVFVEIEHLAPTRAAALAALPVIRAYAAGLGLTREWAQAYTDMFLAARDKGA